MPKKSKKSKDKDADSAAESSDAEKAPPVPETAEEKRRREHCESRSFAATREMAAGSATAADRAAGETLIEMMAER